MAIHAAPLGRSLHKKAILIIGADLALSSRSSPSRSAPITASPAHVYVVTEKPVREIATLPLSFRGDPRG